MIFRVFFLLLVSLQVAAQKPFPKLENKSRFSDTEKALIMSGDTSRMLRVTQTTDPEDFKILTSVSEDIAFDDPLLPLLARRMYLSVTDKSTNGVGIAAPQVGINRNLVWVKRFEKPASPLNFMLTPKSPGNPSCCSWVPKGAFLSRICAIT